jgi:hypothetical protein
VFVPLRIVAEPMAEVLLLTNLVVRLPLTEDPQIVICLIMALKAVAC